MKLNKTFAVAVPVTVVNILWFVFVLSNYKQLPQNLWFSAGMVFGIMSIAQILIVKTLILNAFKGKN